MACHLDALRIDAINPAGLARFWGDVLGWPSAGEPERGVALAPRDGTGFWLRFWPAERPKTGLNHMHVHLTSTSRDDQRATVQKCLALGARHLDVGQRPAEGHIVLADPEGNEFCVIEPGNKFLADCGFLAELACDGSRECGHFWSAALGWPLVWDQDQETAIRSPRGGPKISWGGPPLMPATGTARMRFDLSPASGGDQAAEVERLLALGAASVRTGADGDAGQGETGHVVLADPDGHEFRVLAPR